jgi:hypothetical protein
MYKTEGGILIFTVSFATVFLPEENNVKRYDQHMIMLTLFDKHWHADAHKHPKECSLKVN